MIHSFIFQARYQTAKHSQATIRATGVTKPLFGTTLADQTEHRLPHCLAYIHVNLRLASIVAIATASPGHGMRVDGCHIAFEFGVFAAFPVNIQLGLKDQATIASGTLD